MRYKEVFMKKVTVTKFKANCAKILDEMGKTRERY